MSKRSKSDFVALPDLACACASIRRTARLVTQLYSHEMGRPMEPTQFALLSALHYRPQIGRVAIGRALGLDKTTLSRSLKLMQKNGWIEPTAAGDGRERGYRLTPNGNRTLAKAEPGWKRAQAKLCEALKPGEWKDMFKVAGRVAAAAMAAQHDLGGPKSSKARDRRVP